MPTRSNVMRGVAVAAFAVAPLAFMDPSAAAVNSGSAQASGPGIAVENTGGNVEIGVGHSESNVVTGGPIGPVAPVGEFGTLSNPAARLAPAKPVNPSADAVRRANAIVAAAKARAQAQIDAARAKAAEAVEQAHQQADDARAHSQAQSDAARQRSAESASASSAR
jgi:hypothetical protein